MVCTLQRPCRFRRRRTIFRAWWASGKNSPRPSLLPVRPITRMVRVSTRPWPTERTRAASGTAPPGERLEPGVQRLLVALDPQHPVRAAGAQVGGELAGGEPGIGGDEGAGQQAAVIQRGGQL